MRMVVDVLPRPPALAHALRRQFEQFAEMGGRNQDSGARGRGACQCRAARSRSYHAEDGGSNQQGTTCTGADRRLLINLTVEYP